MLSSWCAHRCIQAAARHTMPAPASEPLQPRPALSGCTQLASPPRWRCCVLVQAAHKACVRERRCEISAHGPVAGDGACACPSRGGESNTVASSRRRMKLKELTRCEVSPRKWRLLEKQNTRTGALRHADVVHTRHVRGTAVPQSKRIRLQITTTSLPPHSPHETPRLTCAHSCSVEILLLRLDVVDGPLPFPERPRRRTGRRTVRLDDTQASAVAAAGTGGASEPGAVRSSWAGQPRACRAPQSSARFSSR